MRCIRVEGKPSMPRCAGCRQPIVSQDDIGVAEITEVPIARLKRDGSIIRETTMKYRFWHAECLQEE